MSNERLVEAVEEIGRQTVHSPAVPSVEALAKTCEGEGVFARLGESVLRLPETRTLDRETGPECVVNREPHELTRVGLACPGFLDGVAEEEPKARSGCAEVVLGAEGKVHLKVPWEEEHVVDGAVNMEVEEIEPVHLGAEAR